MTSDKSKKKKKMMYFYKAAEGSSVCFQYIKIYSAFK